MCLMFHFLLDAFTCPVLATSDRFARNKSLKNMGHANFGECIINIYVPIQYTRMCHINILALQGEGEGEVGGEEEPFPL